MQYELSLKEEINIYINSKLTPTELFVLRLLQLAIDGDSSLLSSYLTGISNGKEILRSVLESLKEKKLYSQHLKFPMKVKL